jgi:hypothetical protein
MYDVFKKILGCNVSESEVNRNENFIHYAYVVPVTTYSTYPAFEISILAVFLGFASRSPYCTLPSNKHENLLSLRATV